MTLPLADSTIQAVQATVISSIGKHGYHTPLNKHMHPGIKLMILVEEVGEVAKELLEHPPTTNSNSDVLVKELLQVAAMALSWAQCADEGGL
jgi:NTP pyrophosphatase (non-canonical NTP hydrolase)